MWEPKHYIHHHQQDTLLIAQILAKSTDSREKHQVYDVEYFENGQSRWGLTSHQLLVAVAAHQDG